MQSGCARRTGPSVFSAPLATGPRTRSPSHRTICGGSPGTAYASRATFPMGESPRGCGDRRGEQRRGGKHLAVHATSPVKGRVSGRVFPTVDIRRTSWRPDRCRTGSQGSDPMEKRPERGWSPARHATMSTEAASCRWGGVSGNSFGGPKWKGPETSGMRRSARNATLERGRSTDRRIASPATPPIRTKRAKCRAGSAIPS